MQGIKGIRNRLMLPVIVMTVMLICVLGVVLALNSYSSLRAMLRHKADATASFLSTVSVSHYKNFEYFQLDILAKEIMKDPEIDYAVFLDSSEMALTKTIDSNDESFLTIEKKITNEHGVKLGTIRLDFNSSAINVNLRNNLLIIAICIVVAFLLLNATLKFVSERLFIHRLVSMKKLAEEMAGGNLSIEIAEDKGKDEISDLGKALNIMAETLKKLMARMQSRTIELETWQNKELRNKDGLHQLDVILRGEPDIMTASDRALSFLAEFIGANVGILYKFDAVNGALETLSTYAVARTSRLQKGFRSGEGLAGQVALERNIRCINNVPPDYLPVSSALGSADPLQLLIMPVMHNDTLSGVIELGSFKKFADDDIDFLSQSLESIAVTLHLGQLRTSCSGQENQ